MQIMMTIRLYYIFNRHIFFLDTKAPDRNKYNISTKKFMKKILETTKNE